MKENWQIKQGNKCSCGGSDEYCGCQNNNPNESKPDYLPNDKFQDVLGKISDEAERLDAIRKYTERAYRCMQAMREVDDPDAFMLTIRGLLDCETPDDFNEIHNFINEIREHLGIEGIYDD